MMQFGAGDLVFENEQTNVKRDLLIGFASSTLYTLAIATLIYWHILAVPDFLTDLQ